MSAATAIKCIYCNRVFTRRDNCDRHENTCPSAKLFSTEQLNSLKKARDASLNPCMVDMMAKLILGQNELIAKLDQLAKTVSNLGNATGAPNTSNMGSEASGITGLDNQKQAREASSSSMDILVKMVGKLMQENAELKLGLTPHAYRVGQTKPQPHFQGLLV